MRTKISVVGAGNVGATGSAHRLQRARRCGDGGHHRRSGKALDLLEAGPVEGYDSQVNGANNYEATADSHIVVITAGIARKPGMSRSDLITTNANIVRAVTEQVVKYSPEALLIVVSNPLDAMVHLTKHVSGFPKSRVVGQAGVLDSTRFRTFIAQELNVSVEDTQAFVLGGMATPWCRYHVIRPSRGFRSRICCRKRPSTGLSNGHGMAAVRS